MIAYSPEELLEIADRELAWCRERMLVASRAMGCGDDWKAALEKVKQDHVGPGEQPDLIRELAEEATSYVKENQLVTVPPLAEETWRMEMMSPERQLVNPFFTGGEVISVSFPTDGMTHEQKQMSLRGNNRHFARATVFHELIPGHHLQQFMTARYQSHRQLFATPFWTEGWALWWEMLLWERGFAQSPQDQIGMLFWRSHRCARIRFSLSFHLGLWDPQKCIDFLVDEIGHERENAAAEVRRSFNGSYGPLYQIALYGRRAAVPRAAPRAGRERPHGRARVPRRDPRRRQHADRDGARALGENRARPRFPRAMALLTYVTGAGQELRWQCDPQRSMVSHFKRRGCCRGGALLPGRLGRSPSLSPRAAQSSRGLAPAAPPRVATTPTANQRCSLLRARWRFPT
jgi:hypothetical protein